MAKKGLQSINMAEGLYSGATGTPTPVEEKENTPTPQIINSKPSVVQTQDQEHKPVKEETKPICAYLQKKYIRAMTYFKLDHDNEKWDQTKIIRAALDEFLKDYLK